MRILRKLWPDSRGVAAVEMAIIAPVIGGMAMVSFEVWTSAQRHQQMNAALDVAVEYYMGGGTDDASARTAAETAWREAPADSTISSERRARCGLVPVEPDVLCDDGRAPSVHVALTAVANDPEALVYKSLSVERVVRVR